MSDTSAPSAPPPSAPAPVQTEVPINPNPPSSPNPVGPQAPQAPTGDVEGSKHRPLSRRETIQAAFDKATRQQDAKDGKPVPAARAEPAKAKPADAKPGHNKPPEATDAEKPKLNLKKRPEDQDTKTLDSPQPRDKGRFAPRQQADPAAAPDAAQTAAQTAAKDAQKPAPQLPDNAPYREPPPRMAEHAKREWASAPESVRGEVHRMHQEFGQAYSAYKGAYDAFMPVARFHKMATDHGTTLEQALTNYTSMEQKLRSDLVGGLDVIINNLGIKGQNGEKIGLRDVAYHVLSQSPEAIKQTQMGNQQTAAGQQIGALHQEINGLKHALHQMHTAQQFSYTRSQVDQFAASHPRFDELGTLSSASFSSASIWRPRTEGPSCSSRPPTPLRPALPLRLRPAPQPTDRSQDHPA